MHVHGRECPLRGIAALEDKSIRASSEVKAHEREGEGLAALVHLRVFAAPVVPFLGGGGGG